MISSGETKQPQADHGTLFGPPQHTLQQKSTPTRFLPCVAIHRRQTWLLRDKTPNMLNLSGNHKLHACDINQFQFVDQHRTLLKIYWSHIDNRLDLPKVSLESGHFVCFKIG